MKYIKLTEKGWDHRPYWAYLDSIKREMPDGVFAFAANSDNHDLIHPNSLHDSWLIRSTVTEHNDPRGDLPIQIEIILLGPRHDRDIHLSYGGVTHYRFSGEKPSRRHGDLLVHEMRAVGDNKFEHELYFSEGTSFLVGFSTFEHLIVMHSTSQQQL